MDDVDALLDLAKEQLDAIHAVYDQSLQEQRIPRLLPARIKNVLENQRSSLDYLATAIRDRYGSKPGIPYYPLAQTPTRFAKLMDAELPGVAQGRPGIRDAIERHQPYNSPWLVALSRLTRENKHRRLTPQQRQERRVLRHESPGVEVEWDPSAVTFGPGVSIGGQPVDRATQRPADAFVTVYVDWLFAETGESVLRTLTAIQEGARAAVHDVSTEAGL